MLDPSQQPSTRRLRLLAGIYAAIVLVGIAMAITITASDSFRFGVVIDQLALDNGGALVALEPFGELTASHTNDAGETVGIGRSAVLLGSESPSPANLAEGDWVFVFAQPATSHISTVKAEAWRSFRLPTQVIHDWFSQVTELNIDKPDLQKLAVPLALLIVLIGRFAVRAMHALAFALFTAAVFWHVFAAIEMLAQISFSQTERNGLLGLTAALGLFAAIAASHKPGGVFEGGLLALLFLALVSNLHNALMPLGDYQSWVVLVGVAISGLIPTIGYGLVAAALIALGTQAGLALWLTISFAAALLSGLRFFGFSNSLQALREMRN